MSGAEKKPESHNSFTAAIRSKRGDHKTSGGVDLAAMEAALEAEIEAFSLSMPPLEETVPTETRSPRPGTSVFPEIVPQGVAKVPRVESATTPRPELARDNPPAAPRANLLDQLRQQAQAVQSDDSSRQRELAAQGQRMDAALRQIFSYWHDLVQQLNVLHPPIERQYSMVSTFALSGLEWKKGSADYRTRLENGQTLYETVALSCLLAKGETLRIERDGIAAESFRKALFDQGLAFTVEEIKNSRQMVEKVVFSIASEVRVNLRCQADPSRGTLVLDTRNLERFGSFSYVLAPEAVSPAMLDEFARLLLGQPNRFREFCSSLCPPAQRR